LFCCFFLLRTHLPRRLVFPSSTAMTLRFPHFLLPMLLFPRRIPLSFLPPSPLGYEARRQHLGQVLVDSEAGNRPIYSEILPKLSPPPLIPSLTRRTHASKGARSSSFMRAPIALATANRRLCLSWEALTPHKRSASLFVITLSPLAFLAPSNAILPSDRTGTSSLQDTA